MENRGLGDLVIRTEFDTRRIQSVYLSIPMLGIDEHIPRVARFSRIPAGLYEGRITGLSSTGKKIDRSIKVRVLPAQENVHTFTLTSIEQEVVLQPVDEHDRTVLNSEMKVHGVDLNFRTVRSWKGISYALSPGKYKVQVLLPGLEVRTIPVQISGDIHTYKLNLQEHPAQTRIEPRVPVSLQAAYWAKDGNWVHTRCVNISTRGVCLLSRPKRIDSQESYLRLFIPVAADPVECSAKVRWTKEEGKGEGKIGLEMVLPDPLKATLSHWLEDLQATLQ